jgi:hypothetical protein
MRGIRQGILWTAAMLYLYCGNSPTDQGYTDNEGGGSEVIAVTSTIADTTGRGIPGAVVRIRPSAYLHGIDTVNEYYESVSQSDGSVSVSVDDTGMYLLSAVGTDGTRAAVRCTLNLGDSNRTVDTLTLQTPGTLTGTLSVPSWHTESDIKAFLMGLDKSARIHQRAYHFDSVPEGNFSVGIAIEARKALLREIEGIRVAPDSITTAPESYAAQQCSSWSCDSELVEWILDLNGRTPVQAHHVADSGDGRMKKLNLREENIVRVPPEIGMLDGLTVLDLSGNQLDSLPKEIGKCTKLETLELYDNNLRALPFEIGRLSSLTRFRLSGNEISSIPHSVLELTNLSFFSISDNRLCADSLSTEIIQWLDTNDPDWKNSQRCP